MTDAFSFELRKVKSKSVKQQSVDMFANVDLDLAITIANRIGVIPPKSGGSTVTAFSPDLSQQNTIYIPNTRRVAVILTKGFNGSDVKFLLEQLKDAGIFIDIISEHQGKIAGTNGVILEVDHTFQTAKSVEYDAVYIGNISQVNRIFNKDAVYFIDEAFSHYKPIGATHDGIPAITINKFGGNQGVIIGDGDMRQFSDEFINAITHHRFWDRKIV